MQLFFYVLHFALPLIWEKKSQYYSQITFQASIVSDYYIFFFELTIRIVSCCFVRPKIDFLVLFNSLKMECEKLAQEKTEMQRHYVMVSEHHFKRDQM